MTHPLLRALARPLAVAAITMTALAGAPAFAASAAPLPAPGPSDFHVACRSGAAQGDGSAAAPWTSLASVRAHGAFAPGDRILLRRGTTCHGRVAPTGSGTASAPIVLGAEGNGAQPIVAGGGTSDGTGAIELDAVGWWTVQDLHVTNTGGNRNTKTKRAGVLIRNAASVRVPGVVVQRLRIDHVDSSPSGFDNTRQYGGIAVLTLGTHGGFDGMVLRDNVVDHVGRTGIAVFDFSKDHDRDLRITGNRVSWARGDSIVVYGVNHARIDHNVSANGSNMLPCSPQLCGRMGGPSTASAGIWPVQANDVRIDHNEVYGEHRSAGDGEGIDVDLYAMNVVVEQNYVHDNEGGGVMFCGARSTTVRFNVIQNNGIAAFTFTCGWQKDQLVKDITITNNDVAMDRKHPARYVVRNVHPHPGTGIRFTNNVVACTGPCTYTWPKKPHAADNTYLGTRSLSEPVGTGSRHGGALLRAPGTARTGFASLGGYHLTAAGRRMKGVPVAGRGLTDLFGRAVSSARPPRGAAVR